MQIYAYAIYNQETTPFANAYTPWPIQLFPVAAFPQLNPPVGTARTLPTSLSSITADGSAMETGSRLLPTAISASTEDL